MQQGFIKVAAVTPEISVADAVYNYEKILGEVSKCADRGAKLIVFPQLCMTGTTCNDLFLQDILIKKCKELLGMLAEKQQETDALVFVGLPWQKDGKLYNVAAAVNKGKVLALIPQKNIANYGDKDGLRYFSPGEEKVEMITAYGYEIPFGSRIVLQAEEMEEFTVACEIGDDLFAVVPPSCEHALAGANVIVNPTALVDMVGAKEYTKNILLATSGRSISGYVMAAAGEGESTQDLVFGGNNLIAENGQLLAEGKGGLENVVICEIDLQRILHERQRKNNFQIKKEEYHRVKFSIKKEKIVLDRKFEKSPFVPENTEELSKRLEDIFRIQASGLKKRLFHTGCKNAVIGISGGLDSTLALLVTAEAFDMLGLPRNQILSITMPCFGTTDRTYDNACKMALALGTVLEEVDIKESVSLHFRDIKHDSQNHNVTYENSQARERTQVLMDIANRENGMVIGTGDMSELVLGWATYNGDHMSMYGVNAGVPKTMVRHLVKYYAENCREEELKKVLLDVLDTPVSPELLPPVDGNIAQKTEDLVGPYELHDFFLYYMLRFGYEPSKIYRIAKQTFEGEYEADVIEKWLKIFCRRFFTQQFKRSCLPDGPKVGSVSVSPRGDLRMPSDAAVNLWLRQLEKMEK